MSRPAILTFLLLATACGKSFPPPPPSFGVPEADPASVESVVFLLGDAGKGSLDRSPLLVRLRQEVEQWSGALPDSAVVVLYLGDNVYPAGLRDVTHRGHAQDSTHLQAQVDVMAGPQSRRKNARAYFIAGNHDWGHKPGQEGRQRLANMEHFIARHARAGGYHAELLPAAGAPGPGVVLLGRQLKMLLIDTAWWLLEANYEEKRRFLERLDRETANRGGREMLIAAHHPWQSGSAHGGLVPFWETIGVKWLLSRSGAALQDLNSLPYRDLKNQLSAVFQKSGPPLLFAGGHDHNLQVIQATLPTEPRFALVSGAGSKSSEVGPTDGMLFFRDDPGYMQVIVRSDGSIDLYVISAPDDFLDCDSSDDERRRQCLEVGVREFRTVYSLRLK